MHPQKAYLDIVAGAALWGLMGLFVRALSAQGYSSMEVIGLRAIAAVICVVPYLYFHDRSSFHVKFKDLWIFAGTGLLSEAFYNYGYFSCMEQTSLAVAALLMYTAPAFVMVMSFIIFKEPFTLIKFCGLITTFIGCAMVTGAFEEEMSLSLSGLIYGLIAGFGYACYSIFGKLAMIRGYSPVTVTFYTFLFASITGVSLIHSQATVFNFTTIIAALVLGSFCAVIPHCLYTLGLQTVAPGQASILATVELFTAAIVGCFAFGETLSTMKLCGMALIFVTIVLLNMHRIDQKPINRIKKAESEKSEN